MGLEVKKVESAADKRKFLKLPWKIYRDQPLWVPPLLDEQKKFLNPKVNPFFETAEVEYFLVLSDDLEPVGRVAAILNRAYNEFHSEQVGFFGMYESIDDQGVADLLLDTAYHWCLAKGCNKIIGPANLSTNHECGLLIEGYDLPPMFGMPYNPPYYSKQFQQWGLVKAKDLVSFNISPFVKVPEYMDRANTKIRKRNRFTLRSLRLDRFWEEVDIIWDVYNSAWSANWGFVPMTRKEFVFSAEGMKKIAVEDFCFIAEVGSQPVGFSLMIPNINQVLKSMNGRLLPFGWLKFLLNKKKIDTSRVLTLGVKKEFQRQGIDLCLYYETYKKCVEKNMALCEMSWVLEDNEGMTAPLHRMGAKIYKRHRIYERFDEN